MLRSCGLNLGRLARQQAAPRLAIWRNNSTAAQAQKIVHRQVNVDRELPDPFADKKKNKMYFWVYAVGVTVSCVLIFNYEKTSSPIINSILYCLRRSQFAKDQLGSNIGFASSWPWIWGQLNTVQGKIDVSFKVKGDAGEGTLKLKASRISKLVPFDVEHILLVLDDGREIDLKSDDSIDFDF